MKIAYVYRAARPGGYSIESVFRSISTELRGRGLPIVDYQLGNSASFIADVVHLWKLRADVYHITGDVNYAAVMLPVGRTILTIHDIGYYKLTLRGWRKLVYEWFWIRLPMMVAAVVTVSSNATRQDLSLLRGVAARDAEFIPLCHNQRFIATTKSFDKGCPRILQIGTGVNKNVPRLIRALEGIDCVLVVIGRLDSDILQALEECRVRYESHVDIGARQVVEQYVRSDVVAFVSTNEGFGMPIIEAQAVGRPVITSSVEPMSIVAGAGACLVDPTDVEAIRRAVLRLIVDDDYRRSVVQSGFANVKEYSASAAADRYLAVYKRLTSQH